MSATGENSIFLPRGWKKVRVRDVAKVIQYGYTASAINRKSGPRFLRITDIQNGHVDWSTVPSCDIPEEDLSKYRLSPGDLVFARTGATTGKSFLIGDCPEAVFASYLIRVRVADDVSPKYLSAYFQSPDYWRQIESGKRGIGQPNVNGKLLGEIEFPLAPLDEQREIVAEIEKQFTRLEAGVAGLRRVLANLKRYRAAVLKAACEGKLVPTEAELARQEGRSYETGAQLLEKTLEFRLLSNKKHTKNYRVPEGDAPSRTPEGWAVCSIDHIAECLDAQRVPVNKTERARRNGDIPYYGANGQVGWIDEHLFDEPLVLVVEDETFTGRTQAFSYVVQGKSWVNNHAHVLRPTSAVSTKYLNYSLAHYPFTQRTTGSTGRRKLTQKSLMTAPYLLPPDVEQTRIVAEVDRRLSLVEELEAAVNANLQRATRLRQSILERAFKAKLLSTAHKKDGQMSMCSEISDE